MNIKPLTLIFIVLLTASVIGNIWQILTERSSKLSETESSESVARIGARTYTMSQLENDNRDILKSKQSLYRVRLQGIQKWLISQAVELEAEKNNTTPDQLLLKQSEKSQSALSEKEVDELIQRFGKIYPDPNDPAKKTDVPREEARKYLLQLKHQQARKDIAKDMLAKYPHAILLQEPLGPRIDENLAIATRPSFGNPNAKVKIVEFSDFECPYCKRFALSTLNKIKETYGESIYVVYRDLPISHHKYAFNAAVAAKCAARESKFWQYHDMLFENQHKLEREDLLSYADAIGLDKKAFVNCLVEQAISTQVEEDITKATEYELRATPTLIINGEVIEGAVSYESLKSKIDAYLK